MGRVGPAQDVTRVKDLSTLSTLSNLSNLSTTTDFKDVVISVFIV